MPDKTLELKFGADEGGFSKIKRMLESITSDVTKLMETARKAQQAMSGIMGGPNVGFGVVGGGTQGALQHAASRSQGPAGILTQGIAGNASLVKAMGQAASTAYKQIGDSSRDSIDKQIRDIQRLRREIQGLNSEQARLSAAGDSRALGQNRNMQFYADQQLSAAHGRLRALRDAAAPLGGIDSANGPMASVDWGVDPFTGAPTTAPRKGMLGRMRDALFNGQAPASGGGKGGGGLIGMAMQQMGLPGNQGIGAIAASPAAMAAAFAAAVKLTSNTMGAVAGENLKLSFDPFRRRQEQGSTVGGAAQRLRGGDMSLMLALRQVQANPELQRSLETNLTREFHDAGVTGAGVQSMIVGSLSGKGEAMRAFKDVPVRVKQAYFQKLGMLAESNPVQNSMLAQLEASAEGRTAQSRALGYNPFRINPRTGRSLEAGLISQGLSVGDLAGAQAGMEGTMGLRMAQRLAGTAMQFGLGHFRGAGDVMGAGFLSGGNPQDLLRAVAGTNGDVGISSRLGQTFAAGMMNGGSPTEGFGFMGALAGVGGQGAAQQMRFQNQAAAGLGGADSLFQGGPDGYQRGRNLLAAIRALGPSGSVFGQEYLANRTSFRQVADIMGGGNVTPEMAARGIGRQAVTQYGNEVVRSVLDRFVSNGDQSEQSRFARLIMQRGGNVTEALKGKTAAQRERGAMLLGTILEDAGVVQGDEAAEGAARLLVGLGSSTRGGRRRSVGGLRPGTAEGAVLEHRAAVQDEFNQVVGDPKKAQNIKDMYDLSITNAKAWNEISGNLGSSFKDLTGNTQALVNQTEALMVAFDRLAEYVDPTGKRHSQDVARYAQMTASQWKASARFLDQKTVDEVSKLRSHKR